MGPPAGPSVWHGMSLLVSLGIVVVRLLNFQMRVRALTGISVPHGVVSVLPRTDLAFHLRRHWRSFHLLISYTSQQGLCRYTATAWIQATSTALTVSQTTLHFLVMIRYVRSVALKVISDRL